MWNLYINYPLLDFDDVVFFRIIHVITFRTVHSLIKCQLSSFSFWWCSFLLYRFGQTSKLKLSGSMSTRSTSIFKNPNVTQHLSLLHDKYVIVPTDKAPNNIVFVCKSHYIDCLITELTRYWQFTWQPYVYPTTLTKEETLEIIDLFCVSLEFLPKWRTGYAVTLLNS